MNFISHDSRSFSFDRRGNGYGRGEGFGVVVLKRLTNAVRDGDTIRAVIRSTGSNQDGRTPGITQPSRDAQEVLINETYAKAGLDMQTTRYVEAHGTGTAVRLPEIWPSSSFILTPDIRSETQSRLARLGGHSENIVALKSQCTCKSIIYASLSRIPQTDFAWEIKLIFSVVLSNLT